MPMELVYPPPTNILVRHIRFGVCYFTNDKGKPICRNAASGAEIDTRNVDITKGWTLYTHSERTKMFHVFNIAGKQAGASAPNEEDAKKVIRAKLGLGSDVEMKCIGCFVDAANCSFEEFQNSSIKQGGNDSDQALNKAVEGNFQQKGTANVEVRRDNNAQSQQETQGPSGQNDNQQVQPNNPQLRNPMPGQGLMNEQQGNAVETPVGTTPRQGETNPGGSKLPPEDSRDDSINGHANPNQNTQNPQG